MDDDDDDAMFHFILIVFHSFAESHQFQKQFKTKITICTN